MSKPMTRFEIVPRQTGVIVVDMQNCFVSNSPFAAPEGPNLVHRLNQLIAEFRASEATIIFARHVLREDQSNVGLLGEILPPVRTGIINSGQRSAELHEELDVQSTDIILNKPRFSCFESTDLELILRSRGIDTLVIGGIATNVCCDTTARQASMKDFKVLFLSDGTATFDHPEIPPLPAVSAIDVQRVICATLALAFAEVLTCAEALTRLKQTNRK